MRRDDRRIPLEPASLQDETLTSMRTVVPPLRRVVAAP